MPLSNVLPFGKIAGGLAGQGIAAAFGGEATYIPVLSKSFGVIFREMANGRGPILTAIEVVVTGNGPVVSGLKVIGQNLGGGRLLKQKYTGIGLPALQPLPTYFRQRPPNTRYAVRLS